MKKKEEKIAVVVYNYIQYLSIMPGIKALIKEGYDIDFYVARIEEDNGLNDMFSDVIKELKKEGFKVYRNPQNIHYKIVIEPYISHLAEDVDYFIKYRYGPLITTKPSRAVTPDLMLHFDCVICSGPYEARVLNPYAHTEQVADLKYIDFKRKNKVRKDGKKVLLYLPTFDEESSIDSIIDELEKLKKDYYIITKFHHGTSFLKAESDRLVKIKDIVDEWYDLHTQLRDLLEIADVVLSDNSGAIYEAMLNFIPVAIFSKDINHTRIGEFSTTQYELYKAGILPYTDDAKKIKKILKDALSEDMIKKQNNWAKETFIYSKDPVKDFVTVINNYYNDNIDMRDFLIRRGILEYIAGLKKQIAERDFFLKQYREGKLYTIATKIYSTQSKLRKKK